MKKLIFHRYTTGVKKTIWNIVEYLNNRTKLTHYDEVIDIIDKNYDPDKKLYIEIKVWEYE